MTTSLPIENKSPPRVLSKSKLLSFRQCPKRLWLEVHRPELIETTAETTATFAVGHQVGNIARRLFDPEGRGQSIDVPTEGVAAAVAHTQALLTGAQPIFEAGFEAGGARAFADVLLPVRKHGKKAWRIIEVKSSASVKDYHRDDAAIQASVARKAGLALAGIAVAHVDSTWIYKGDGDYQDLLVEEDLTQEAFGRDAEVQSWVADAQAVVGQDSEPKLSTGKHCNAPFACGFFEYCQGQEPQTEYPVIWLPRIQMKALKDVIEQHGLIDLRHVPDEYLNPRQLRVKTHTVSGDAYFAAQPAAASLAAHILPAYFLDFETIQFAVPIWKGTHPYQQLPFQFSVHRLSRTQRLESESFLDLTGKDPGRALAKALLDACGARGPIFAYSTFEATCIRDLAKRFPRLKPSLTALHARLVDLRPITEEHYYHPSQQGSWSIKKVLSAIAPELRYDALPGVKDGGMAMEAYVEAIAPATSPGRREQIRQELIEYCALDTLAMVKIWEFFSGRARPE
jgi:uncharacterized protein DUF2779